MSASALSHTAPAFSFNPDAPVSAFSDGEFTVSDPVALLSAVPQFEPVSAEVLPAKLREFQQKRATLLKHMAGSERLAEVRPASRLEVKPLPEMISSGVAEVDAMTSGIPRGCLTEIWGGASSGKTSVLMAAMAAATRRGETCVLIDASDSFDPASGEAAEVNLQKLLWVRCGEKKWSAALGRYQSEKKPSRVARCASHEGARLGNSCQPSAIGHQENLKMKIKKSSERRLEQVLKATDLILQSGGFGLIVLDLAGIGEKFVRRIPLASWFRFQRAVEHTKSALIVVSEMPCAQTCATLGMEIKHSALSTQHSGKPAHAEILEKIRVQAEVMRSRLERKPAQSVRAEFESQAVRVG